jgi:hypothetical protein
MGFVESPVPKDVGPVAPSFVTHGICTTAGAIPALGFRPLYVLCSPLWICYVIDLMMVTGFSFLVQKAKMG